MLNNTVNNPIVLVLALAVVVLAFGITWSLFDPCLTIDKNDTGRAEARHPADTKKSLLPLSEVKSM